MTSIVQRVPSWLDNVEPWSDWDVEFLGHYPHKLEPGDYDYPRYKDSIPGRWPVLRVRWARQRSTPDMGDKGPGWVADLGRFEPTPKGVSIRRGLIQNHMQGFRYLYDGDLWPNTKKLNRGREVEEVQRQFRRSQSSTQKEDIGDYLRRLIEAGDFSAKNRRVQTLVRVGQSKFRNPVLLNFHYKCAVCGLDTEELLDAAHIRSYADHPKLALDWRNGVALCVLHHRAMDRGLLWIEKDGMIQIHKSILRQKGNVHQALGRFHKHFIGKHNEWVRLG